MRRLTRPLIGDDRSIIRLMKLVTQVAPTDTSVLVLGESGTGKELVARALHDLSDREGPMVAINCGAIPENLLESELFGHVKGAYTGASQARTGRFLLANGGTVFLDEIGDMSPMLQVKLLRVLQERCFEPVGGTRTIEVDIRVVAATNKDLEAEIEAGRFREDLFYRLNVVELTLPPLRNRTQDIPVLMAHFNARMGTLKRRSVAGFTEEAMSQLQRYAWPGNVRELENVVERLTVFCMDETVELEDLPEKILERRSAPGPSFELPEDGVDLRALLNEVEERLIRQALERTSWNKNQAAALLRMNRTTLVEKLKKRGMLQPESKA